MRALCGGSIALVTASYTRSYRSILALKMSTIANNINSEERGNNNHLLRNHLKRLQSSPSEALILDGGTGEELFLRGVPDDRKIWSAKAIVDAQYHSILEEVHNSFIDAGSHAITTNSYGITPGVGFVDGEEVKRLVAISGQIARRVVTKTSSSNPTASNPTALVLGSLGPLVESYRPDLIMKHDDGVKAYQFLIEGLYPNIDIYLAETMSCLDEACQAVDAISKFYNGNQNQVHIKHPLLVSFTLNSEGQSKKGEPVIEVIPKLIQYAHEKKVECEFLHCFIHGTLSFPFIILIRSFHSVYENL